MRKVTEICMIITVLPVRCEKKKKSKFTKLLFVMLQICIPFRINILTLQ